MSKLIRNRKVVGEAEKKFSMEDVEKMIEEKLSGMKQQTAPTPQNGNNIDISGCEQAIIKVDELQDYFLKGWKMSKSIPNTDKVLVYHP